MTVITRLTESRVAKNMKVQGNQTFFLAVAWGWLLLTSQTIMFSFFPKKYNIHSDFLKSWNMEDFYANSVFSLPHIYLLSPEWQLHNIRNVTSVRWLCWEITWLTIMKSDFRFPASLLPKRNWLSTFSTVYTVTDICKLIALFNLEKLFNWNNCVLVCLRHSIASQARGFLTSEKCFIFRKT